jgi:hypothetical protein
MEQSTFSWAEPPAKISASADSERDWMESVADCHWNICDWLIVHGPRGWYGRTLPEFCRLTEDGHLVPSSGGWRNSGMGSPTEFLTLGVSTFPTNPASGLSWSQIVETGALPERYYLSARALKGISQRKRKPPLFSPVLGVWLSMTARRACWVRADLAAQHRENGNERLASKMTTRLLAAAAGLWAMA